MLDQLRKCSLVTGFVGLSFFVQGYYIQALCLRIVTEMLRVPSFHQENKRDQVALGVLSMLACSYGIIRLTQSN